MSTPHAPALTTAATARPWWARAVSAGLLVALVAGVVLLWPARWGGCASLTIVSGHSMDGTYADGDLVVGRCGEPGVGDVVVYSPRSVDGLIVHRVVGGGPDGWVMRGDANEWLDPFRPTNDDVVGIVVLHVPGVAWLTRLARTPLVWLSVVLIGLGLLRGPVRRDDVVTVEVDPGTPDGDPARPSRPA